MRRDAKAPRESRLSLLPPDGEKRHASGLKGQRPEPRPARAVSDIINQVADRPSQLFPGEVVVVVVVSGWGGGLQVSSI